MNTVIFACVHNAGRSQMTAALFNQMADPAIARAISAGTEPADRVHPEVVEVMREVGVDLAEAKPALFKPALARYAQVLVTMGCGEVCPAVVGLHQEDWGLPDPKGQSLELVREIRDQIRERVVRLVRARGWGLRS